MISYSKFCAAVTTASLDIVPDRAAAKEETMRKDIEFKTQDGVMLRGWHYLPEQRSGKVPSIS